MNALDKILSQPTKTHDLVQGTRDWDHFRLTHRGASEAAAVLGLSKNVTRNELLRVKHTGIAREFSDFVQERVLDKGHEVEALARPHVEAMLGEDLYPVTCSRGGLSASCDGLTVDDRIAFEHKQWNEELAALVAAGTVPDEHMPQCQQIMLVTGAEEVHFVVSDGTPDRMVTTIVTPDRVWWGRIADGWEQFDIDLAAYVPPPAAAPAPVAKVVASLPVVFDMRVEGRLVSCNLEKYKPAALAYIAAINTELSTDQHFVDATVDAKYCRDSADKLELAIEQALGQMGDINAALNTVREVAAAFDAKGLALEKLVESQKKAIKEGLVLRGQQEAKAHIDGLNTRLGKPYMPTVPADFGGAVKGLRTVDSVRNAVDTEVSRVKIEANRIADGIQVNLNWLREHAKDYTFLFNDAAAIVLKSHDDLQALAKVRIAEHKAEQDRKEAAQRESILAEEQARADKEAREKIATEQREAKEAEDALIASFQASARRIEFDSVPYIQKAIGKYESVAKDWENDSRPRVLAAFLAGRAYLKERLEIAQAREQAAAAKPTPTPVAAPAVVVQAPAANSPIVVPMQREQPTALPTMTLGQVNELLGRGKWSEADLTALGFPPAATRQNTKLYFESDFGRLCESIIAHVRTVQHQQAKAA